jgi:hypothetical protein
MSDRPNGPSDHCDDAGLLALLDNREPDALRGKPLPTARELDVNTEDALVCEPVGVGLWTFEGMNM